MADENTWNQGDEDGWDEPERPLAQDHGTPSEPPEETDDDKDVPPDHPVLDSKPDEHELYDEGRAAASEANTQHEEV